MIRQSYKSNHVPEYINSYEHHIEKVYVLPVTEGCCGAGAPLECLRAHHLQGLTTASILLHPLTPLE